MIEKTHLGWGQHLPYDTHVIAGIQIYLPVSRNFLHFLLINVPLGPLEFGATPVVTKTHDRKFYLCETQNVHNGLPATRTLRIFQYANLSYHILKTWNLSVIDQGFPTYINTYPVDQAHVERACQPFKSTLQNTYLSVHLQISLPETHQLTSSRITLW